ncbi:unannotated protein [freshwater metagenome]|uniref:Unannotated protein n=1 Tax=freshwater metagenome TaxID=449393 RepID=A0A6J6X9M8_9ZZZZ
MRVALAAVTQNGDLATLNDRQVCIFIVKHFSHGLTLLMCWDVLLTSGLRYADCDH